MSITSWEQMARDLVADPELEGLSDEQIKAIIDVLAMTLHADENVSPVEVAGFNHLFFDLPWLEERHELVREHIPRAVKRAVGADALAVAGDAAKHFELGSQREKVFQMAAILASVDSKVKEGENAILVGIAEAFDIDEERRSAIIEASKP